MAASMRPIQDSDEKLVRFMIAKSNMEPLAVANRRTYYHPIYIAVWLVCSSVFMEFMNWYPKPEHGWIGYLQPLPAFGTLFVPLMFAVDWVNRPYFENRTQEVLRAPDLRGNIKAYYSRSLASGFWIVEFDGKFVGLIAIDASVGEEAVKPRTTTSEIATIRHFYVQEPYPAAGIQDDMLSHAVDHCFTTKHDIVQKVQAPDSPLVLYAQKALKESGFVLEKHTETIGVSRWKLGLRVLERNIWEQRKKP
ncbi:hypothetical protein R3P38DRAFT_2822905 [Favolaschia claudopus]|uniref:N-acetyltransferase domain-containing protein n=1 Tax=Favolaschia claudopus TaxID=2862362 RepID=A0AAW0EFR2_9AGAR